MVHRFAYTEQMTRDGNAGQDERVTRVNER
jgi:hypothetical protein